MRAIDYKKVDMTDAEYDYYTKLVKTHSDEYSTGEVFFKDLFDTDDDGFITMITPDKSVPWAILWFVQNLMINQRMRVIDNQFRNKGQ